jgi:cysteinyl-tRNA synthetase
MAKSSGEFLRMQTLVDKGYDPLSYRYLCLTAHYRSDLNFTWESLDGAVAALGRLRTALYNWDDGGAVDADFVDRFNTCVNDDLNTARALAVIWDLVKCDIEPASKRATLLACDCVLGLGLAQWEPVNEKVPDEVMQLVTARENARTEKRWDDADNLRSQVDELGYTIDDTPAGSKVHKK